MAVISVMVGVLAVVVAVFVGFPVAALVLLILGGVVVGRTHVALGGIVVVAHTCELPGGHKTPGAPERGVALVTSIHPVGVQFCCSLWLDRT
ncbi:hypothetical protein JCM17823_24790 [Halorubrum gandharaense]